jgi:hypothetical protein
MAPRALAHPVATDLQPATLEEPSFSDPLSHELQLAVAFELLHHFDLAEKSRSLSSEELDLIKFLVAQVALLSFSLAMEDPCEVVIVELQDLSSVACEVMELQSDIVS